MLGLLVIPVAVLVWVMILREHRALQASQLPEHRRRLLAASRWQLRLAVTGVALGVLWAYLPVLGASRGARILVGTLLGAVLGAYTVVVYLKAKWRM